MQFFVTFVKNKRNFLNFLVQQKLALVIIYLLVNNRVIVIENRQKNFQLQLQLQLSTFENLQLQLQQIV